MPGGPSALEVPWVLESWWSWGRESEVETKMENSRGRNERDFSRLCPSELAKLGGRTGTQAQRGEAFGSRVGVTRSWLKWNRTSCQAQGTPTEEKN